MCKQLLAFLTVFITLISCGKDEGKLPEIKFKIGGAYISRDTSIKCGTTILMGIDASKSEERDVLKKFNITLSNNGGSEKSLLDKILTKSEEDKYSFDYNYTLDTANGQLNKFIFTIVNRDGIINQVSLTVNQFR